MTARQVLVVDDEIGIRELLRDILEDEGYQVRLAENAAEAREFRQHARPDVVLRDICRLASSDIFRPRWQGSLEPDSMFLNR